MSYVVHLICSARFAGVEQHVARLASAQAAAGHRVAVLGGASAPMSAVVGAGVSVRPAATLAALRAELRRLPARPALLHAHMTSAELVALAHFSRLPIVSTRHFAAPRGATAGRRTVLRGVRPLLSTQIAVSRYVADAIGQPSTVVYAGVPQRPAVVPHAQRRVAVVGRLEAEKSTHVAIEAFAASGLAAQGWSLSLVGDGAQRDSLEQRVSRLGLADAACFHGHLDDIGDVLADTALLLAPCPVEALGLAVLEAMAAGLPVVAARAGGHLETVGAARPDLTFAPGDADEAAALLCRLAAEPAAAWQAGADLRELQRRSFTVQRQNRETDRVYASVLTS